jgi:hypothetical protein
VPAKADQRTERQPFAPHPRPLLVECGQAFFPELFYVVEDFVPSFFLIFEGGVVKR